MMEILPIQSQDIDQICHIENSANQFPWSRKNFDDSLLSGYQGWIGRINNEVICFAIVQNILDEAHLLNICVIPLMQAKGHGKQMLYHVISCAQQRGASLMVLEVRRSNRRAHHLYTTVGFNEMSIRRGYYPALNGREDAILMGLEIFPEEVPRFETSG